MAVHNTMPSSDLKIHLLGTFQVYVRGQALPEAAIKGRKARSLLKLIALQRNAQIVRDQAMDTFWPDLDSSAAASQLYKALHHIRKAFATHASDADEWIDITDDLVRLVPPGGTTTDLQVFETKARAGLRDGATSDLQMAVSAYAGDLLPTDFYAGWAALPREHYRQLYMDVLVALATQYEQRGQLSEAAEMLRLALEKDPALEAAHRGLMRIFAKRGQATRSIRQFELCKNVLQSELGVEPAPDTVATLKEMRRQWTTNHSEPVALGATVPTPLPPIVGRGAECTEIERLLDRLAAGAGAVLIIQGGIGMGKTRLTQELALRSRHRGYRVFSGSARDDEGRVAYAPFVEVFEAVLHQYPALQELLPAELGRLVPSFTGEGVPVPHADRLAAQGYLFAQVHRFFGRLAEDGPVVVIVDDLHAADEASQGLFQYLARRLGDLNILFAAATVEEASAAKVDTVQSDRTVTVQRLRPLTFEDHTSLLEQHTARGEASRETVERIYRISEGNPLFALELQRFHAERRTDDDTKNGYEVVDVSPEGGSIPPSLRSLVGRQLEELSPAAHHLLFMAAVIGRHVPFDLLSSVWRGTAFVEEEALFEPLEDVVRTGLFVERGLDYSFRHALVRAAIYESISEARRRAIHALVARRLIDTAGKPDEEPVEQIAHHLVRAGEMRQGVHYLVRAGERAEAAYAHEDALQRFREALAVLERFDNDSAAQRLRRDILERIGDVYRACGKLERSYEAYSDAVVVAEDLAANTPDLVDLHRKIALVGVFRTEVGRSERHLALAFDLVGDDPRARARLLVTKALVLWHLNRLEEAAQLAHEALDLARSVDATAEASQACEILAMTYLPLGKWEEGLKYEMERQVYGWSPEIVVAIDAHLCLWEYHVSGDQPFQQARAFMQSVAQQASRFGNLRCVAVCHYALGTMHLWRGESREAVKELDASLQLHDNVGSPAGMAYALARKGVLHTMRGAVDLGWQAIREGIEHAEQAAVRDHCLQRLYGVGIWNRFEADDFSEASELVERSMELLDESGACPACALELYPYLAYFYLQAGDFDRARECGNAVAELAEKTGNPIGRAVAAMIESSLLVAEQDDDGARRRRKEAFHLAESAVTEATHSPVVYYLDRMTEQQSKLRRTQVSDS